MSTSKKPTRSPGRAGRRSTAGWAKIAAFPLILAGMLSPVSAEPKWFPGTPKEAQALADQTKRGLALYFETEQAADCQKMAKETWPKLDGEKAGQSVVWVRLNPKEKDSSKFFDYYDVFQTPEIVVLDAKTKERGRIKGFVEPQTLMDLLTSMQTESGGGKVILPTGEVVAEEEFQKARAQRKANEKENHFYYESFDKLKSLDQAEPGRFDVYVNKLDIQIDPNNGVLHSPGLAVRALVHPKMEEAANPAAAIRIDLSLGLDKVDLIEGRMRIAFTARVLNLTDKAMPIGRVRIVNRTDPPYSDKGEVYTIALFKKFSEWGDRVVETKSFNFRTQKAYLDLWVDAVNQWYYVDDLRVDLLPPDTQKETAAMTPEKKIVPHPETILEGGTTGNKLFDAFDLNHDGRVDIEHEIPEFMRPAAKQYDKNHDGFIDIGE